MLLFFIGNYLLVCLCNSVIQDLAILRCAAWPVIVYITIRAWCTDFSQARDFPCSFERSPFLRAGATGLVSIWPTSLRETFETLFPRNFLPLIVILYISSRYNNIQSLLKDDRSYYFKYILYIRVFSSYLFSEILPIFHILYILL